MNVAFFKGQSLRLGKSEILVQKRLLQGLFGGELI